MKSNVKVLAFIKRSVSTDALFRDISTVTYIDSLDILHNKLRYEDGYVYPRILVVCAEYILDKQHPLHVDMKWDLMYKNASIVVYGKDIPLETRHKLYALDVKGIIDEDDNSKDELFTHIRRRTNLHSSSFKNNSARGVSDYFGLGTNSKKLTYTLDYLIYRYNVSDKDASDIYLALIYLLVAFKQNRLIQTSKLINTIFKSYNISRLYKNYTKPKSFNEKVLCVLLSLNEDKEIAKYIENINLNSVELELIKEIKEIYSAKNIAISSYQDIAFFWEQLYMAILEWHTDLKLNIFDTFLNTTNTILVDFLAQTNYFLCSIKFFDNEKIAIDFKFPNTRNSQIKDYATKIAGLNFLVDESDDVVSMIYHINSDTSDQESKSTIDTSNSDSIHYKENKKISAVDFLKEYEIDHEILDDLHDNAREIKELLYDKELLSQNTLDTIVTILQKYVSVLYETIEFEDIAFTLEGLATLFLNVNIDEIEKSKKEMLSLYIQGLVDDLNRWKDHIFIDMDTPDIHYLDDSLLENASEIEAFLLSKEEKKSVQEDDDLEFF